MHQRREYLEDQFLAQQLAKEEEQAQEQKKLNVIQDQVDTAYVKWLDASERKLSPEIISQFQRELDIAQRKLEQEKKRPAGPGSAGGIYGALNIPVKALAEKKGIKATPLHVFTQEEMKKINQHYLNLPEELQKLMDAAIGEDINMELAANPVFIRGEGKIYDINTVRAWLKGKDEAMFPLNQDKRFKESDIIPCNTLIKAMNILLNIIGGEEVKAPEKLDQLLITEESKAAKRVLISAEIVQFIEKGYVALLERHKVLFDTICRDPKTRIIMDDPVMLPDGYIYDRSTVNLYLKYKGGQCPLNDNITFTQADITPCVTIGKVLEQLRDNILQKINPAKGAGAGPGVGLNLHP